MVTLEKFIYSDTAKAKGIDNKPTDKNILSNIDKVIEFLNSLEVDITITSGYRCEALNKAVGGVSSSHHKTGWAVDITTKDLLKLVSILKTRIEEIDQLIYYPKRNFVHVSIHPSNRKQYFIK